MSEDSDKKTFDVEKAVQKTAEGLDGLLKGNKAFHGTQGYKYTVEFNTSTATAVNVMDKTARSAKAASKGRPPKGDWVFRLDRPHGGAEFNHVNINSHISGVADPHLPLPPGALGAGKGVAKVAKVINKVNKVAVPVAIAVDAVQMGYAVSKDIVHGTSRNMVETGASVAGGWGGGYGGAMGGAAIGSLICPGVGTIAGGLVGGLGGGICGSMGASALVDVIGDACDYDIIEKTCETCGKKFKVRVYLTKADVRLCPDCQPKDK